MPEKEEANKKAIYKEIISVHYHEQMNDDFKWKMGPKIFQIEICEMLFCFGGNGGSML